MKAGRFHRQWRQRLKKLLTALEKQGNACRARADPEDIHVLRVVIRRSRLLIALGEPVLSRATVKKFRRWSGAPAEPLCHVRDCDVAMEWLTRRKLDAGLSGRLRRKRAVHLRNARPLLKRMSEAFAPLPLDDTATHHAKTRLLKSFQRALRDFRGLVLKLKKPLSDLDAAELHAFRRGVRRLRYLRELLLSRRAALSDPLVTRLVAVQDALGEVQNRRMMRGLFAGAAADGWPGELEPKLQREEKRWLREARNRLRRLQLYLRRGKPLIAL
ncbi:MAG: CHAD domain-containing protein [Verrucomicrobia bacterium]|nr:CHAD domain-containing protein [Verrucomicrobiota bacterium]